MRLRRKSESGLRLFYAGDVHGSEKCWRKFLNAARFYEVDTLVMGGDITGKVMVPVVEHGGGRHRARVLGRDETVDAVELEELEKRIRFNGFYPYRCDRDEYGRLESDSAYREQVFTGLMVEEVRRWIRLAEERLEGSGVRCYVMPGNDDEFAVDAALESSYVVNPDNRVVELDGLQMLSCSWTNPTPWDSPREEDEEALSARLEQLAAQLDPARPAIFNLHCPPAQTTLDRAPQLTKDLQVVLDGGEPRIVSVGSRAVRELIERHQPLLSLHGHIHESKAIARIGRTTCVNPGSAYSEGVIDGAVVELRDDSVKACQLVTG
jgi:Icc-related predicted phosphoesterase